MFIFKRCSTHGLVGRDVTYNDDVIQTRELVQRALSKRSDCSEHSDNTDLGTCFECCQGDYCNKEGCGTTGLFLLLLLRFGLVLWHYDLCVVYIRKYSSAHALGCVA